ncbi:TonB-dependent receptor family protein [Chryseolinea lacunae]|uniref:TonB-dependent receptor n=1 Tax=Chryseolinea lacunae TaxID=2801331 RepID=A0ABS1KMH0_9BACT|nr:TonB-dependent receptor [Chryseolinea lacunae]MBL0740665.1 TonB-dependent receptor [Chryseolinea lacunae]
MNRVLLLLYLYLFSIALVHAQETDTVETKRLSEVLVTGQRDINAVLRLPELKNTFIFSGKKTEVINVQSLDANITEKTPRQIFAKVPGIFVYDMDGTGNQINIAARGLDPHRGWEFNIRRNGAMTNSDIYAYPASHYSIPMEAVERIEIVRGTGSLQYGAQFGGMLNYITKQPDSTKAISFESINGAGSFGLLSTYNAVSGTIGKFQYYAYITYRKSDGYRDNSESKYDAQSVMLVYNASKNFKISGEFSRSNYVYQIPGPLTDSMFHADPRMSTRARNYFNPEIYVPSLKFEWQVSKSTRVQWLTSAVLGDRNSVQFDRTANVPDAINPATDAYAARQVDVDHFHSFTTELRFSHGYNLLNKRSTLTGGIQLIRNDLNRQQQGKGTTGTDFDLTLTDPLWGRDMHLKSSNVAVFLENNFKITEKLSVNPGVRVEVGDSKMYGSISYYPTNDIPNTIEHKFPLFGISAQYVVKGSTMFYGGWSQAYRPVIFKDIIPATVYESVNKNLKDADGYNLDLGFRGLSYGASNVFRWDVSVFQLQYNNRLGSQATRNDTDVFILYRTNIGNSKTTGAEIFLEYSVPLSKKSSVSVFTSTALMRSRYTSASVRAGEQNVDVSGNKVESVPDVITRNGMTVRVGMASISLLYSFTGETYADPLNTEKPGATGAVGLVPSYGLLDINASLRISDMIKIRLNLNNATNEQYFTKRPTFYPGPGVWPSDGRSFTASIGFKI